MIDAGTGLVPATKHYHSDFMNGEKPSYTIFFTHYHWDHILGLTLAPPTFINQIPMQMYGPVEEGVGPKEMVKSLFNRPFFPVDDKRFRHKITFHALTHYDVQVIAIHPVGGYATFSLDRYNEYTMKNGHLPIGKGQSFPISECLIVTMVQTNHGNANCISYRFEEKPTGKTFVFCTDHEDVAAIGLDFRRHLSEVDLLIIDAQYSAEQYINTAGFGHGTPYGCIKHSIISKVKRVGLTHHDPGSTDQHLEDVILHQARSAIEEISQNKSMLGQYGVEKVRLTKEDIFLCADYETITV